MLIVKYESKNFFGDYEYHEDRKTILLLRMSKKHAGY